MAVLKTETLPLRSTDDVVHVRQVARAWILAEKDRQAEEAKEGTGA